MSSAPRTHPTGKEMTPEHTSPSNQETSTILYLCLDKSATAKFPSLLLQTG
ncbi:hypothetical protein JOB18_022431 [Solea senegalensis]|uniref:Uncharacterized protein n=1 Tax=Solea senegalensis TaxID=28829 RepID=A0AAV6RCX8_SOLSE|nr:hypothetical protein JOB18_022431 [Solea senegalensis]